MFGLLVVWACGTPSAVETPPPAEQQSTLPAEGKVIYPAVEKSEIPSGAWMCDMGTVHFAATEKNDGICPVCKMKLTQKP